MKNKSWPQEEVIFLKENYPTKGSAYCAELLKRDKESVMGKANYIGLSVNKNVRLINNQIAQLKYQSERPDDTFNVNIEQFLNIKKPEIAYLLGFLWADGYIIRTEIRLEIIKDDMENIKPILDSIGTWTYSERQRKNWKVISRATTSNKRLIEFLKSHDYNIKSKTSADKILSKIPNELKHYFFRGLIDGDGFIDSSRIRTSISSNLEQDWSYINNLCYKLNIKGNNYKFKNKYSYSTIEFNGINAIKFCDYIYNDKFFGLNRKYNKYLEMKNRYENSKIYLLNIKKKESLFLYNNGMSIGKIIKTINIPRTTLRRYLKSVIQK
jgi:hypothetical protein